LGKRNRRVARVERGKKSTLEGVERGLVCLTGLGWVRVLG